MNLSRRPIFAVMTVLAILSAGAMGAGAAEKRDGVLVHLTHGKGDAHRVLMALNMAALMSEDHPVLVYFDIEGIETANKARFFSFTEGRILTLDY